jgi:hypothetical protein
MDKPRSYYRALAATYGIPLCRATLEGTATPDLVKQLRAQAPKPPTTARQGSRKGITQSGRKGCASPTPTPQLQLF